ncbi:MAG: hypothetical protein HQL46_15135 [Gammaproteobacteria bacterium]|nr:hypothetical protein [Gammaproteobacteria bacterium]
MNRSPADDVVMEFARYLRHDHGLAEITIKNYTRIARQFLLMRFNQGEISLRDINVTDIMMMIS